MALRKRKPGSKAFILTDANRTRVGNHNFPRYIGARCKVCNSLAYRDDIEQWLLRGYTPAAIASHLPEDAGLSKTNIIDHVRNGHLQLDEHTKRVAIETRAKESGWDPDEHDGLLADHVTFARLGVQKVFEKMMDGGLEPDIRDGIALASLLVKVDEIAGQSVDYQQTIRMVARLISVIEEQVPEDILQRVKHIIQADPIFRSVIDVPQPQNVMDEDEDVEQPDPVPRRLPEPKAEQ
jgi:hypothetical protein